MRNINSYNSLYLRLLVFSIFGLFGLADKALYAQAYMHEAAEDSDGDFINGVIAFAVIFGIVKLFQKLTSSENDYDEDEERDPSEGFLSNDNKENLFDKDDLLMDRYFHDSQNQREDMTINQKPSAPQKAKEPTDTDYDFSALDAKLVGVEKKEIISKKVETFAEKVIRIYANQTEKLGGRLIIKEDGEYHFLFPDDDERFSILSDYIDKNLPENKIHYRSNIKLDWDVLMLYELFHKDELPRFNPIESANVEKNDFLGGKLLILRSYYLDKPVYSRHPVSQLEFFTSVGFEEIIKLHKIIKQPMSGHDWYEMKVMEIKKFTYEEYQEYCKKAGQWYEDDDGWYDCYYGYLGPTHGKATEVYENKVGYSHLKAFQEVKEMDWNL